MSFRSILPVLMILVCMTCALPVRAAEQLNAEGAQKLKAIFERILSYEKDTSIAPKGAKFEYEGNVMVEQTGTYYAVTLPHARFVYPDGGRLDIGMVSINASPGDLPGQWKMAVAIPTPIILMDAKQTQAIKINIGAQKAAGIWDESLENFAKLDAQYKDITIENPTSSFTMQIPETDILYDFTAGSDGKWSGPGSLLIKNITAAVPGLMNLKIAEIKGDFSVDRYNPAVLKDYKTFLQSYMQDTAAKQQAGQKPDPEKTSQLADKLSQLLLTVSDGFKSDYTVSGIDVSQPGPAGAAAKTLKVDKAYFGMGASGMLGDKVSIGLRTGYDGFVITPVPPGYEGVLPSTSNIDLAMANVPVRQITEIAKNTLQGSIAQPETAKFAGLSLLMKAPAILSQAATYIDIKNNYIGNDEYRFELNGQAKADINAVDSFTADMKGVFRGLDRLLVKIQAVASNPTNPAAKNAQSLASTLTMLKSYGKPDVAAGGEAVYKFDLLVNPAGQMTVNGKPISMVTPPVMPPAAPTAPMSRPKPGPPIPPPAP